MEQKSSKNLKELPKNESDFWNEAKTELIKLGPNTTCERSEHKFVRNGRFAKCKKCRIGFILSGPEEIKEEHIYIKGQFLI